MCMQFRLKDLEQDGSPCRETGGKTGRATRISTAKASPSRSLPAMAAPSSPTMSHRQAGPSARPLRELNFDESFF